MASSNTPTTLGSLEFTEIKKSLTDYLKGQSVFSGYNFEGSAMQTMIDMLAYNTFYYAYYANIINAEAFLDSAQKEDSMISLCKPLGFTVPSRTAAKAKIKLGGVVGKDTIPARTTFIASNNNGIEFSFYNLEDIPVIDEATEPFDVYEAIRYVEFDALSSFDFEAQKISIADTNFDLSTIKVTITEIIDELEYTENWSLVQNIGYTAKVDENIYFIERTSTGFSILFGSKNSVGKSIDITKVQSIIIRYITTSGSNANNLSLFKVTNPSNGIVQLVSESSGGREKPDLDYVRFIAPKWFAAQERAVTVNDYKALLLQSGYFTSQNQFNVFGGQDLRPPKYGRVFVTSIYEPSNSLVSEMIQFLKERSIITVFPEYISPSSYEIYVSFIFSPSQSTSVSLTDTIKQRILTKVKSIFNKTYSGVDKFNAYFSASEFIDIIRSNSDPDVNSIIINPDNFKITCKKVLESGKEHNLNLENELYLPLNTSISITDQFNSDLVPSNSAILKMYAPTGNSKNVRTSLELWDANSGEKIDSDVGFFVSNSGVITIKTGVIKEGTTATLNVQFNKKSFLMTLDQLIAIQLDNNVAII